MSFFSQVGLLLWKNFLLQSRNFWVSLFELLLPFLFAYLLVMARNDTPPIKHDQPTTFASEGARMPKSPSGLLEIGYTPAAPILKQVMQDAAQRVTALTKPYGGTAVAKGFKTEKDMVAYHVRNSSVLMQGVVFKGMTSSDTVVPDHLEFNLRVLNDYRWYTQYVGPLFPRNEPRDENPDYNYNRIPGMLAKLVSALVRAKNQSLYNDSSWGLELELQRIPVPPYTDDDMIALLPSMLPMFVVLSFCLSVFHSTKAITYEKEVKMKEAMKLMGLSTGAHWVSWFLTCFFYLAVAMGIYTYMLAVKSDEDNVPVLPNTEASLFYMFLLCYAAAIVAYCIMISTFVQKANVGAVASGLFYFGMYLPNMTLSEEKIAEMNHLQIMAYCLDFNLAMVFGMKAIGMYEDTGEGATWNNYSRAASAMYNFSLQDCMLMMFADTVLYTLIAWYVDNVFPGDFGIPKPFYFCFMQSYWCEKPPKRTSQDEEVTHKGRRHYFEREPSGLKPGIKIINLRKEFGPNVAVNNLSLNMYEGQITVLLGHNGAGKTTTMSMLTGFFPPTSGTAYISDYDICTDMDRVRDSLGLCPQYNILFDTLTCEEHLYFFAKLKGCPQNRMKEEVDKTINTVGLESKRHNQSHTLSGGQKRKLCVGIAFIGGSRVVILDEPTAGMDPAARRQTWDILQQHRTGRTLVLTTHFMDEADVLGDRIAIMAEGVIKCCGTSMFLKKLYGAGYHLTIVKAPECDVNAVTDLITSMVPGSLFESEQNQELTYLLPEDQSATYPDLFRQLEEKEKELGIQNFGASATTLEEVFLKVAEDNPAHTGIGTGPEGQDGHISRRQSQSTCPGFEVFRHQYEKMGGAMLQLSRFKGVLVKKAIIFKRNRLITIIQLSLPVLFAYFAMRVAKQEVGIFEEVKLALNLSGFPPPTIVLHRGMPDKMNDLYASPIKAAKHTAEKVGLAGPMKNYFIKKAEEMGGREFNKKVMIGAEFEEKPSQTGGANIMFGRAWYNGQMYHTQAISAAYALRAMAKFYVNKFDMTMNFFPFPRDKEAQKDLQAEQSVSTQVIGLNLSFTLSIGMAFLTASFIYFLIQERKAGAKHMQVVSGVCPILFWVANLLWDYFNYSVPASLIIAIISSSGPEVFFTDGNLGLVSNVLFAYGWASITLMYLLHFAFQAAPTGVVVVIVFTIFSGLVTQIGVVTMRLLELTETAQSYDDKFSYMFPNYCMSMAFVNLFTNYMALEYCRKANYTITCMLEAGPCCKGIGKGCGGGMACMAFAFPYDSWEYPGIGRNVALMQAQGFVYLLLLLLIEHDVYGILKDRIQGTDPGHFEERENEDDDVAAERRRINSNSPEVLARTDSLIIVNLYKRYGNFVACDRLCIGIPERECFGLLGQNGAGKTTTFKMLTGDVSLTGGNAYMKGYDVKNHLKEAQSNMGYCPQFDALIDQMTGRETLTMYARLRGVPDDNIPVLVDGLVDIMLLRPHVDKPSGVYSGGNRRKLSTCMALVGDPHFVLLDEPSSGMDPAARRQMWDVLSLVRACGRTLVLTSHSMEECEALCTRVAIMVNGRFVCLGSLQHLKSKFGQGYTLIAQMQLNEDGSYMPHENLFKHIQTRFKDVRIFEAHQGYVHMQVPDPNARLADVFQLMEDAKVQLNVRDYAVQQTTLEQVFLSFLRLQQPPKESSKTLCQRICFCF